MAPAVDHADLERAVETRVRERAVAWFPDVPDRPAARLTLVSSRPRSRLYTVSIAGSDVPRVVAKVRLGAGPTTPEPGSRPRLATGVLPTSELTALEYSGLVSIEAAVAASFDERFSAVRPLDHLTDHDTILMEYVDARTLRDVAVHGSRLSLASRARRTAAAGDGWTRAGAWLRLFQDHVPPSGLPVRQSRSDDIVAMFHAYDEFLGRQLGARRVGDLARRAAELATSALPEETPLAVGHGDYAPRNVFVGPDGSLMVFDPMPRWAQPRLEDLCRFLVGLRLLGPQLHSHGAAYGREEVEARERQVLAGYFGTARIPEAELRVHQLLILLDKWSALVDQPAHGWQGRLRARSVVLAGGFVRAQGQRLLALGQAAAG
jgi:hypothetical protein